jgi:hypothetical protein
MGMFYTKKSFGFVKFASISPKEIPQTKWIIFSLLMEILQKMIEVFVPHPLMYKNLSWFYKMRSSFPRIAFRNHLVKDVAKTVFF